MRWLTNEKQAEMDGSINSIRTKNLGEVTIVWSYNKSRKLVYRCVSRGNIKIEDWVSEYHKESGEYRRIIFQRIECEDSLVLKTKEYNVMGNLVAFEDSNGTFLHDTSDGDFNV